LLSKLAEKIKNAHLLHLPKRTVMILIAMMKAKILTLMMKRRMKKKKRRDLLLQRTERIKETISSKNLREVKAAKITVQLRKAVTISLKVKASLKIISNNRNHNKKAVNHKDLLKMVVNLKVVMENNNSSNSLNRREVISNLSRRVAINKRAEILPLNSKREAINNLNKRAVINLLNKRVAISNLNRRVAINNPNKRVAISNLNRRVVINPLNKRVVISKRDLNNNSLNRRVVINNLNKKEVTRRDLLQTADLKVDPSNKADLKDLLKTVKEESKTVLSNNSKLNLSHNLLASEDLCIRRLSILLRFIYCDS